MIPWLYLAVLVLAGVTLGSAVLTVTLRNLYHCALSLALCLVGVAGLYVVLSAEFIAAAQVLIYVGAVTVLILFAVMMTEHITGTRGEAVSQQRGLALLASLALAACLIAIVHATAWPTALAHTPHPPVSTTLILGRELLTTYLIPFEVASVVLLAALVGAVVLAKEDRPQEDSQP
ncbi:MAG: NADH-quinone oxidoreductase subunit J family protein [Armatimonadota bacterium]